MPDTTIPKDAAPNPDENSHGGELAKTFRQIEAELSTEDDLKPSAEPQDTLPESRPQSGRDPKSPR